MNISTPARKSSSPPSTTPPVHMASRITRGLMVGSSGIQGSFTPQDGHTAASRATSLVQSRHGTVSVMRPLLYGARVVVESAMRVDERDDGLLVDVVQGLDP